MLRASFLAPVRTPPAHSSTAVVLRSPSSGHLVLGTQYLTPPTRSGRS